MTRDPARAAAAPAAAPASAPTSAAAALRAALAALVLAAPALLAAPAALAPLPAFAQEATEEEPDPLEELAPAAGATRALETRVVNGVIAPEGKYGFVTALALIRERLSDGRVKAGRCGGAQIADRWVMTAAHCVVKMDGTGRILSRIQPGDAIVGGGDSVYLEGLKVRAKRIIPHPDYGRPYRYMNDIALIELERPVPRPVVALPRADMDPPAGLAVKIVGWGLTRHEGELSKQLREGASELVGRAECQAANRKVLPPDAVGPIDATRICADVARQGKPVDSCQGDSGGPLLASDGTNWMAVGVVSYGYKCAVPGHPGVYTNVAHFRPWIDSVMRGGADAGGSVGGGSGGGAAAASAAAQPSGGYAPPPDPGLDGMAEGKARRAAISARGGAVASVGDTLVFDVESPVQGALVILESGPDGVRQLFPNDITRKRRVPGMIGAGGRFSLPGARHGFRLRAATPGAYVIMALILPEGADAQKLAEVTSTRGLGLAPDPGAYVAEVAETAKKPCAGGKCAIGLMKLEVR